MLGSVAILLLSLGAAPEGASPVDVHVGDWRTFKLPAEQPSEPWLLQRIEVYLDGRGVCAPGGKCHVESGQVRSRTATLLADKDGRPLAFVDGSELWRVRERDASGRIVSFGRSFDPVRVEYGRSGELRARKPREKDSGWRPLTCTWQGRFLDGPPPPGFHFPFAQLTPGMVPHLFPEAVALSPDRAFRGTVECREGTGVVKLRYDASGRLESFSDGPLKEQWTYDAEGRLATRTTTSLPKPAPKGAVQSVYALQTTYAYDGPRLTGWTATQSDGGSTEATLDYDAQGRLVHRRALLWNSVRHTFWRYPAPPPAP